MLFDAGPSARLRRGNQIRDLIPALDGVRGLAVLLVLLDHASDAGLLLFPGADFNRAGKYGVYLFFALSAFLLTYPFFLRDPADLLKPRVWTNYWVRRILRIVPLYTVVLVIYNWDRDKFRTSDVWDHLLLREGQGHFWTIPVEFKFYMALPFLVFALGWAWRVRGWRWGLAAGAVFYFVFLKGLFFPLERFWSPEENVWLSESINFFLFGSLAGILHAWIVRHNFHHRWLPAVGETLATLSLTAVVLFIPGIFNVLFNSGKDVKSFDDMAEFCAVAWPVFLLGVVHGTGWLRRIFEWGGLRYLGLISYSAYLWHKMILGRVLDLERLPPALHLLIYLLAVVLLASISYWIIEWPMSRIRLNRRKTVDLDTALPAAQ